jgi:hypothetical protein
MGFIELGLSPARNGPSCGTTAKSDYWVVEPKSRMIQELPEGHRRSRSTAPGRPPKRPRLGANCSLTRWGARHLSRRYPQRRSSTRGRTGVARMILELSSFPRSFPVAVIDTEKGRMPISPRLPKVHRIRDRHRQAARLLPVRWHGGDRFILRSITDGREARYAPVAGYVDYLRCSVQGKHLR